jgi:arylsulfatase A-like enzyme
MIIMNTNTAMGQNKSSQRPSFLIIITDQQRWDALRINENPDIQSPNLDRLANEGRTL